MRKRVISDSRDDRLGRDSVCSLDCVHVLAFECDGESGVSESREVILRGASANVSGEDTSRDREGTV